MPTTTTGARRTQRTPAGTTTSSSSSSGRSKSQKWADGIARATHKVDVDIVMRIATSIADLTDGVAATATTDLWRDWVQTAARMHRYSANNMLLIHHQDPRARQVASERDWKKAGYEPVDRPVRLTVLARVTTPGWVVRTDLSAADLRTVPGRAGKSKTVVDVDGDTVDAFVGSDGRVRVKSGTRHTYRPAKVLDISQVTPVDGAGPTELPSGEGGDPAAAVDALIAWASTQHIDVVVSGRPDGPTRIVSGRTVDVRATDPTRTALEVIAGVAEVVLAEARERADKPTPAPRDVAAVTESAAWAVGTAAGLDASAWALPAVHHFVADVTDPESARDAMKDAFGDVVAVVRLLLPVIGATGHGGRLTLPARN